MTSGPVSEKKIRQVERELGEGGRVSASERLEQLWEDTPIDRGWLVISNALPELIAVVKAAENADVGGIIEALAALDRKLAE